MPFIPRNLGNIEIPITINTKPLLKAIIMDSLAYPIAVKYDEYIILNPLKINEKAYNLDPVTAKSTTNLSEPINIVIKLSLKKNNTINVVVQTIKDTTSDNFNMDLTLSNWFAP